jgi:hypothetical protein
MAGTNNLGAQMNPADYLSLKAEITNDPKALGYASKSDYEISVVMNTPGASAETLFRSYTPVEDLVACIVRAEYDALAAAGKTYLDMAFSGTKVKTGDSTLRTQIGTVFGAGTTTRTNLTNAASRAASRAEILFGENAYVSDQDVAIARNI